MDKAVTRDGRENLIRTPTHLAKLVLMPQMEGQGGKENTEYMASSFISFIAWKHILRCNLKFLPLSVLSTGDPLLEVETDVLDLRGRGTLV